MFDEEDVLLASAATLVVLSSTFREHRPRRFWMRPSLLARKKYSATDFMRDLILDDVDELNLEYRSGFGFKNFFRMSSSTFETLLNMTAKKFTKVDTIMREAIPAHERLAFTLRFLASGDSYHSLSATFKVSKQVMSVTIPIVCDAIVEALQDFVKMPQNESDWKKIAKTFEKWNFPNCVGAMDGRHIHLQQPIGGGSEYFNYKRFHSIVLFALVDGDYNFIYANVGCQGRISDGGVFDATYLKKSLEDNTISLPTPCALPGTHEPLPFVFLGDDAFPLTTHIMKPFPGEHDKGSKERIFNYRLSRGRRISENVFGISTAIYRVLRKPMLLEPHIATKIVLAIIHLHNFLRKSPSKRIYTPPGTFDRECLDTGDHIDGIWRRNTVESSGMTKIRNVARRSTLAASNVRNKFMEYFCSPQGEVQFQYRLN